MSERSIPTRERILDAAGKLFYGEGIRAVSVDAVAAKAGVTKRTLYYHFRSKDDLIAAYLEARDAPNLALFQSWFADADGDVSQRIAAVFSRLAAAAEHPRWQGCGFLRTSVELFTQPGHPAMAAARAHKRRVEDWFAAILGDAGLHRNDAARLARQILLLLDGGFAVVLLHRDPGYLDAAGAAAAALVEAAIDGRVGADRRALALTLPDGSAQ